MSANLPRISVVIPTLNGGSLLRQLLQKLTVQSVQADEILVIDSSSTDETVRVAEQHGATVVSIGRDEFEHGTTRNLAIKQCSGDIVLFFTQDAVPATNDLIEKLVAAVIRDQSIAISYGRQLPHPDASLSAAALRTFNYPDQSRVRTFSDRETLGLKTAFVSNSCAAYRRSCLEEIDYFQEGLVFGEDTCAAGRLLKNGYAIAYVAEAAVFHSHNYSLLQEFRRSFDIGVLHNSEYWLIETFGRAEGEGGEYVRFELSMILQQKKLYLLPVFFLRNLAKYSGYKLGSKYHVLPQWLLPKLSMNCNWWKRLPKG
ncbi:MAG: glycosyltransferase [Desulfocapsa sp.]|nr:glycosyltransferase [Desulfocapsa sp.]